MAAGAMEGEDTAAAAAADMAAEEAAAGKLPAVCTWCSLG